MRRRRALAAMLLVACAGCYSITTIVLVRHAERPPGADPELLPEGWQRAGDLARVLERARVRAVLHTSFKRTRQTAESLAARSGVTLTEVPVSGPLEAHVQDVLRRLLAYNGGTVVYVGHSNTVPAVIKALGIDPAPAIADSVYDRLYIVTKRRGETALIEAQYGCRRD